MTDLVELLEDPAVKKDLANASPEYVIAWSWRMKWLTQAHDHQILPHGDWWTIWLLLAGRGAGKTRTAAEQIGWWAYTEPGTRWLVAAPTSADVRATCFEGDSGLLAVIPKALIADYNKTAHELRLTNGSLIKGIPASEPERFRGPQFHGGWCLPAGTSILMAGGTQQAVETVVVGDMVQTRFGPRRVTASALSGNPNELVAIDCGATSLTLTVDHPILVGTRWIPAGELTEGDLVWVATSTLATGTRTGLSTSSIAALSQPGGLFTTRTKTRATTTPPIWRPCHEGSTSACTPRGNVGLTSNVLLHAKRWSGYVHQKMRSASTVARALCRTLQGTLASSALAPAWSSGGTPSLRQSRATASSASKSTWQSKDSRGTAAKPVEPNPLNAPIALKQLVVRRVERLPNCPTYNLTVDGEHEYIANNIVVHNCDELAAWDYLQAAWEQIMFGVRLGERTRLICTTTPRPKDLIIELVGRDGDDVAMTTASTYTNLANLSKNFQKQILQFEGTKLGRQEIYAEIIDPEEGGIVKRNMFKLWPAGKEFPKFEYIVQSYDCATSEKTQNDPTAAGTWGVFKPLDGPMSVMLIDCWQDRLQYPDLRPKVMDEYEVVYGEGRDKKRVDLVLVEDKSAGISLIQDLQRGHLPVMAYNPGKADKVQRLNIVSNIISRGRVWIPESDARKGYVKDWAEPFVSQICSFPETTHDDFVDMCTQALRYLRDAGWLNVDPPPREDYDEDDYEDSGKKQRRVNPYAV
jgi:predicted phage terminase large subunit-like protein